MTTPASKPSVWTQRLKVCSYDADFTHRATSVSVCRYFLDAAWNHADLTGSMACASSRSITWASPGKATC